MHGIPAIAVSLATDGEPDFGPAADFCRSVVQQIIDKTFPAFSLININVPPVPATDIRGVTVTRLGNIEYENAFERRVDPRGRVYYWMAGTPVETLNPGDTDVSAIRSNQISLTPIHFDLTDYALLKNLQQWNDSHSRIF